MAEYENRRKYKRIKIKTMSKLNDANCSIVNISRDGMLLSGDMESPQPSVDIQLKINGQWIGLAGTQMWAIPHDASHYTRMGVFITNAPPEYKDFIDNLYLEADQETA